MAVFKENNALVVAGHIGKPIASVILTVPNDIIVTLFFRADSGKSSSKSQIWSKLSTHLLPCLVGEPLRTEVLVRWPASTSVDSSVVKRVRESEDCDSWTMGVTPSGRACEIERASWTSMLAWDLLAINLKSKASHLQSPECSTMRWMSESFSDMVVSEREGLRERQSFRQKGKSNSTPIRKFQILYEAHKLS